MSLNITFTCNNIVDENENDIDCNYKAYYVRQGIWNDTRSTEYNQFNFNAGDADSLSQTGELKANDVIIIALWQDDLDSGNTSSATTGLKTRFTTFAIVHDGSTNTYVIDPQLKPKMVPTCAWVMNQSPVINESYNAVSSSDDEDSWTYNGHTFYHRRLYYTELVFDSVGNITDTYDFESSGTFDTSSSHTYTSIADFTARHKAENSYSLSQICDKTVRSYYHVPTPDITFSPDMVLTDIYYGQDLTVDYIVNNSSRDIDTRVTGIDTKLQYIALDSSVISEDSIVDASATDIQSIKTIDLLSRINAVMTVNWNDGWTDKSFIYHEQRQVENTLPTTELFMTNLTARNKRFSNISNDADGLIKYVKYSIYLLMPFGAGYTLVQETTLTDAQINDPVEVTFSNNGHYKTVLEIHDNANELVPAPYGVVTDEIEFDISVTTCTEESYEAAKIEEIFFIFPDTNIQL